MKKAEYGIDIPETMRRTFGDQEALTRPGDDFAFLNPKLVPALDDMEDLDLMAVAMKGWTVVGLSFLPEDGKGAIGLPATDDIADPGHL